MLQTAIFLGRYDDPTVAKAASLIELAGEIAALPGGDDMQRWALVFDWIVENAGGMDRSKGEDNTLPQRLSAMIKRYPDDQLLQNIRRYISGQDALIAALRAQMLFDRGLHIEGAGTLHEEIAFWRGDLAARLCFAVGLYRHAVANGDNDRAIDIEVNSIRPWLASLAAADAKEWHERCDACGEFVRPDQLRAGSEDISGHAACLLDDPSGRTPEGVEWQAKAIADAKAIIDPTHALSVNKSPESLCVPGTCKEGLQQKDCCPKTCVTCDYLDIPGASHPCVTCLSYLAEDGKTHLFPNWVQHATHCPKCYKPLTQDALFPGSGPVCEDCGWAPNLDEKKP